MRTHWNFIRIAGILLFVLIFSADPLSAQIERFIPRQGGTTELWRITKDPSIRHWANYHNKDAWSPDGRYVCYEKYEPYDLSPESEVFVYDLYEDKEISMGKGQEPRWANNYNWLFFVKPVPEDGPRNGKGSHVMWMDMDSGKLTRIAYGVTSLGETDYLDRWIYGSKTLENGKRNGVRIPVRADSRVEILQGLTGSQWNGNPFHPVIFSREDNRDSLGKDIPFAPTRLWCDPEGGNISIGSPMLQRCHQNWSGDGEYLMHGGTGGTLMSGRKWNEPFPSNLHVITAIRCGDISACGKSGRWICGSGNYGALQIADRWSGDGRDYLQAALSYIHDSYLYSYNHGSALNDNDSKGSSDGTKIIFVSNYDLKDGPVTVITEDAEPATDKISVRSTDGFPEKGSLSVGNEIVGYSKKTSGSFEGLTRNLYKTTSQNMDGVTEKILEDYENRNSDAEFIQRYTPSMFNKIKAIVDKKPAAIRKGMTITSFDARMIPEELRKNKKLPTFFESERFPGDKTSPLLWQNRTDVYIAVVRLPDQPYFNRTADMKLELIPGENHWETYGYNIFRNGKKVNNKPLKPGETLELKEAGTYAASAVEWSGLESEKSFPVQMDEATVLNIRLDKPADFSWTKEKWLVDGREVTEEEALKNRHSVKETHHLVDGLLNREWYDWGQVTERHDLNEEGRAIRRLFYKNGKLAKREYYDGGEELVSRELFDDEGQYIIESMQFTTVDEEPRQIHHFWYEKGFPVKFAGRGGRHAADEGPGFYRKEGDDWVKKQELE